MFFTMRLDVLVELLEQILEQELVRGHQVLHGLPLEPPYPGASRFARLHAKKDTHLLKRARLRSVEPESVP
jgi:hypothetical protein